MPVTPTVGRSGQSALTLASAHGSALVYLQGAHLTSWRPAGEGETLFVSDAARFGPGESIRGGVPVAFPQFAELGPLPMHGFAHVVPWEWTGESEYGATLTLRDSDASRRLWPHRFIAELTVELAPRVLRIGFVVRNADRSPLRWSGTLHTFLALDTRRTVIRGLGPGPYLDRGRGGAAADDPHEALSIPGHTDRAYLGARPRAEVDDTHRRIIVSKQGFRDWVVWNPGPETSPRFPDLLPDDHTRFVCVEAAEVRPVQVDPGTAWSGNQVLKLA